MDCFLCQKRTVHFDRRKTVESFHYRLVCNFQCFLHGFSFDQFRCHAAGGNCGSAAERLKFYILNNLVIVDIKINAHDVSALGVSDSTHAAGALNLSYVSRMLKMIHNFFTIHNSTSCFSSKYKSGKKPV